MKEENIVVLVADKIYRFSVYQAMGMTGGKHTISKWLGYSNPYVQFIRDFLWLDGPDRP
jgi:hypothetical protein